MFMALLIYKRILPKYRVMKPRSWLWILFVAAIFLYTFNLGNLPLRDWDEGIVATVAREIYRRGDMAWLFPVNLDGSPYWNKPPLVHNAIALCYGIFGVSEWSSRIFPAVVSACAVPLVYLIGKEIFNTAAVCSAVVYLTLIPVVRHQRLAMLDGVIVTEFCFAVWCLLLLRRTKSQKLIFLLGLCFSLLSLTKGIAIAVLLYGLLTLFIATEYKSYSCCFTLACGFIFCCGLVPAVAWYGLQYLHYGQEFLNYNLGVQTFNRIANAVENNSQPPWYYVLEILKYGLPWLIFLPKGMRLAWQQRDRTWAKLAIIWFGGYLLAISLMTTKLPWYVMPLYPGMSLLVGAELDRISQRRNLKASNIYAAVMLFLGIVFCLGFGYLALFGEKDLGLIAIALILGITFLLAGITVKKSSAFTLVLALGIYIALLTLFTTPHSIWELAESYPVKPVAELIRNNTPSGATIYTNYPWHRPSLNFYSDRIIVPLNPQIIEAMGNKDEPSYLLQHDEYEKLEGKGIANIEGWQLLLYE